MLNVKLKYLDADNEHRRRLAKIYFDNIRNPYVTLPYWSGGDDHVFHIFAIRSQWRDKLQEYLTKRGVQTLIHYPIPPHRQECYKEWNTMSFPITERIHVEELSLPMSAAMTPDEALTVARIINDFKP